MDAITFASFVLACAPAVHLGTARALTAVESSFNPHAIGVVGGMLERQPRNQSEALATARQLQALGWNFSIGLGQINARNLDRLGLSLEAAFDPCQNLRAMQTVLLECFERAVVVPTSPTSSLPVTTNTQAAQTALRRALSCYYSGNFSTGFKHGYVRRVARAMPPPPP